MTDFTSTVEPIKYRFLIVYRSFFCGDPVVAVQYIKWQGRWFASHHSLLHISFYMMHSYTASRALHILSISSVEGPLSSKLLIWLISVNVVVAAVRLLGCILPNNRRIWLLVPWVASFVACSSLLGLACSMRINGISHLCFCITQTD